MSSEQDQAQVKLCECGCGSPTPPAKYTNRQRGRIRGLPLRFINGHNGKFNFPLSSKIKHNHTTHTLKSPEYRSFSDAKQRCTNPKLRCYSYYGGRGIEFRFRSFEEFFAHLGPRPEPKRFYTLDRINNNGHYEVGNVKWATRKEQQTNTRPNKGQFQYRAMSDKE